ncbi:S-adenosyl-L-methionine-dependent methyltransferase [Chaetomium tenue]|uniref:S-adenosyl-L-methionine-dependent methyltransferase n=1 Tax=Chaetomium tenue TaxID=1854479 RepID=A0ACB7P7A9_9PEZI|nr:S-adenosyl-L-methionine-dependent methyltransferase [Chaetomium globosum]
MSAPSIPNLLSLRGGATGRGRGRARGGPGRGGTPGSGPGPSHDATIQGTDSDAAVSRLSAVELGYLSDSYARLFVQGPATRRLPIINRGTYTRTTAIDALVDRFLASTSPDEPRQIVSLGAGTDTRCLRLFASAQHHRNIVYHEIDFPATMVRKQALISSTPLLRTLLSTPEPLSPTAWHSHSLTPPNNQNNNSNNNNNNKNNTLTLHGLDLRTLTPSTPPLPNLLPAAPTLLLSECCLCYLPPQHASAALSHFSTHLPHLALVLYEPILPHDAFGKTMASNLAARGIGMPTLEAYPTPADQERRLREAGFAEVRSRSVDGIWEGWVGEGEKERVDLVEGGLDEVEEWRLLAGHYIVAWGWRGGKGDLDVEGGGAGGGG